MKTKHNLPLFLTLIISIIAACHTSVKEEAKTTTQAKIEKVPEAEVSDMSLFQLPAEWETQDGKKIKLADLQGDVLVAAMIYTSCKAACPRLVADMKNLRKKVGGDHRIPVKYLLFSIDPKVDTPEKFKAFSIENKMDEDDWIFLRSSEDNTRELANVLAVRYASISPMDFSHSNIISVFDKNGVMKHQQEGLEVDSEVTVATIKKLSK